MNKLDKVQEALEEISANSHNCFRWLIVNWEKDGELIADEVQPEFNKITNKAKEALAELKEFRENINKPVYAKVDFGKKDLENIKPGEIIKVD